MPEPINVGINVVGDSRSGVQAFDATTAAAKRTEQQVQQLAATVQKAQNAWAAPTPGTAVPGGMQPTGGGLGSAGRLLLQGGLTDVLGGAGISGLPSGGASVAASALASIGPIAEIVTGAIAVAQVIGLAAKELNEAAKISDKLWGPKQGDPRQAASAQEAAQDVANAGRRSTAGDIFSFLGAQLSGKPFSYRTSSQLHSTAMKKMIDAMDPGELLTVIPLLSGDDQKYAQDAYNKEMQRKDYQASWSGATGRAITRQTNVVFNVGVLGGTQDAQSALQRALRNNGSQTTITAPRAP